MPGVGSFAFREGSEKNHAIGFVVAHFSTRCDFCCCVCVLKAILSCVCCRIDYLEGRIVLEVDDELHIGASLALRMTESKQSWGT